MANEEKIIPENILPTNPVIDPLLQGSTPVTEADISMINAGISPYPQSPEPIPQAVPYPEPTMGERAMGLMSGFPILGLFARQGVESKQRAKEDLKMRDAQSLKFFETIMEKNPRQAGELLKSPVFRDPFMRMAGATGEDINNLASTLSNKQLSPEEITKLYASGGMLNESGEIIPRPYKTDEDVEYKKKLFEDFSNAYQNLPKNKGRNKDELQLETYMAYNALDAKKGRTGNRYTLGTAAQNFMIIDQDDPNPETAFHKIPTGALRKFKYAWVQDDSGTLGFVMLPESLEPGMDPTDIPVVFKDAAQFLAENGVPASLIRNIVGDRRLLMQKVGDLIRGIDPGFTGWLPETIPGEQVKEGDVVAPPSINPNNKTKYIGPAQDQTTPVPGRQLTEAEQKAIDEATGF